MLSLYHSNKKVSYKYNYYKVAYKIVIQKSVIYLPYN